MNRLGLITLVLTISSVKSQDPAGGPGLGDDNEFETCWERCYQLNNENAMMKEYRPAYSDFYDMGMEARRLKNMRSVNGTVLLIDSTLGKHHDSSENMHLQEYEESDQIWEFQRNLAIITTIMLANNETINPVTLVQFNERAAWTCDDLSCLDHCEAAAYLMNNTYFPDVQLNASSHRYAKVEPACRLGFLNLHNCETDIEREMAIAIVNSNFRMNTKESDEYDDYSPCDEHFDTRYAIGTHAADYRHLRRFSTLDAHPIYIKDNPYTMEAAEELVSCMTARCCSMMPPDVDSTCVITTDDFGENVETFNNHPMHVGP